MSSLRYTCLATPSTHAASCWKTPMRGPRDRVRLVESHSQTRPRGTSSHDSHVPQGVGPPAQLGCVLPRMR